MTDFLDFASFERLPPRKSYLLAPDGLCQGATPDGPSPFFAIGPSDLLEKIRILLDGADGIKDLAIAPDLHALRYVAVTKLLRFKDDIDIRLIPDGDGCHLAIYSRSRIGRSDLGTNKKRVLALLDQLT